MQFTVIGAGAIGGTVGAHLARAGHDVLFCDADADHVAAMNRNGLHVKGPVNDFVVAASAVTPDQLPDSLGGTVLLAVKSQHTTAAVEFLRGRLAPDAVVVSLQNGLTVRQDRPGRGLRAAAGVLRQLRRRLRRARARSSRAMSAPSGSASSTAR